MSYCEKCGAVLGSQSKFCSSCGVPVQRAGTSQEPGPSSGAHYETAKSDKRAFAFVSVFVLLALVWLFYPRADPSVDSFADEKELLNATLEDNSVSAASADEGGLSDNNQRIPISIRTIASSREEQAFLVPPLHQPSTTEIVAAVEDAGHPCRTGLGIHQLEQNGERMDVYKVDCSAGSYQLTEMNGQAFIKPWTGVMVGQ